MERLVQGRRSGEQGLRSRDHSFHATLAFAQHHPARGRQVEHRGLLVERDPPVEDQVDVVPRCCWMSRRRSAAARRESIAGGRERPAQAADQRGGDGRVGTRTPTWPLPGQRGARNEPRGIEMMVYGREDTPHQAIALVGDDPVLGHFAQVRAEEREGLPVVAPLSEARRSIASSGTRRSRARSTCRSGTRRSRHPAARHGALDVPRLRCRGIRSAHAALRRTAPQPRHIQRAVGVLQDGGIVSYPTDTYYALGCDVFQKKAMERLASLKRRDDREALRVPLRGPGEVAKYGIVSNESYRLMRRILPARTPSSRCHAARSRTALTGNARWGCAFPKRPSPPRWSAPGRPLATTSASIPGEQPLIDAADIQQHLGHDVDLILDGGITLTSSPRCSTDRPRGRWCCAKARGPWKEWSRDRSPARRSVGPGRGARSHLAHLRVERGPAERDPRAYARELARVRDWLAAQGISRLADVTEAIILQHWRPSDPRPLPGVAGAPSRFRPRAAQVRQRGGIRRPLTRRKAWARRAAPAAAPFPRPSTRWIAAGAPGRRYRRGGAGQAMLELLYARACASPSWWACRSAPSTRRPAWYACAARAARSHRAGGERAREALATYLCDARQKAARHAALDGSVRHSRAGG